jgi:hypothetical protein
MTHFAFSILHFSFFIPRRDRRIVDPVPTGNAK